MPVRLFSLLLCLALLGCAADRPVEQGGNGEPLGAPQVKPNIIYILADDLGYGDLGSFGQTRIQTPNLDAMAAKGLRFTDHYAGAPVCAPSRCVLMTGKHTGKCFTRGNYHGGPEGYTIEIPETEPSLPKLLQSAGYKTAIVGKWGIGPPDSASSPNNFGFDFFYGFLDQRHAHNHYPDYLWRNNRKELTGNVMTDESRLDPIGNGVAVKRVAYANDLFFKESSQWIEKQAKAGEPFFLYLAMTTPHTNNGARQQLKYMPKEHRAQLGQEVPDLGQYADKDWPGPQKGTAAMISRFDRQIGELVRQLEALGVADNTLIMFTSDNGPHAEGGNDPAFFDSNGPLRGIKRDLYEGGIRVPTLAYWPGKVKPGVTDHISSFEDALPTFAELAGIEAPAEITGISFVPTLLGEGNQTKHDYLYWAFYEQRGKQAVRLGKWKGVRLKVDQNKNAPIQLFDLSTDLGEQNDIAKDHPGIVAQIQAMMEEAQTPSTFEPWQFQWEK
ncbi:MAG: arylsulfatase [Phycisphaeraceae bacterium]